MSHYFIDNHANEEGSHEVHKVGCRKLPTDKRYLGNFQDIDDAMMEARKEFWRSSSCERCMRDDHADTRLVRVSGVIATWGRLR